MPDVNVKQVVEHLRVARRILGGFKAALAANHITQSMSGKGNCCDNAVVESFFATLKTEEVDGTNYETRQQVETSILSYLEGFYNVKRRHSSLGFLSTDDFGRVHFARAA